MDENKLFDTEPKTGSFMKKQGFYIVLALCLLIVGAAVAVTALPQQNAQPSPTGAGNQVVESRQSGDETLTVLKTPVPAATPTPATVPSQAPATPAPTPTSTQSPAGNRPARKGSAPVKGEILWNYAMEQLLYSRTLDQWTTHAGVDIAAETGTEVRAVFSGTVAAVYTDDALGQVVTIEHTNGRLSLYGNLDASVPVEEGQKVNEGDVIGLVGSTALSECGEAPHLHFGFFVNERPVDPAEHCSF
ncbi:MAG: peptidoglycan DD-metalloendopeptidase family protein [Candidatus Aphodomorpha sp.]